MRNEQFRQLMDLHTDRLLRIAYYYSKDLQVAEDIVQEVFIKFYQIKDQYEERGELQAYLARMTINKSKDYLKSWHVRKIQFHQKWAENAQYHELDSLIQQDEERMIGQAIMRLPLKQREVLVYYYFEEMTIPLIAQLLQLSQSTVKTRLVRGRELLKQELKGIEWEVLLHE